MGRTPVAFPSFGYALSILIVFLNKSRATDTITKSQPLLVGQNLTSSGNNFELGFFSPGNSGKLYIGIWYKNIPWKRPVWVANRQNPLASTDSSSIMTIGDDGNLVLVDGNRSIVWSTNVTAPANGTIAEFSDKGNLILKNNGSGLTLWESFDHPCDTLFAGIRIGNNSRTGEKLVLSSWKTEEDPSPGDFILGLTTERPTQNFVWDKNARPHWRSGPWNQWTFIGLHDTYGGYSNGYIITQDNTDGSAYGTYNPPSMSEVLIELLTTDGNVNVTRYDVDNLKDVDNRSAIEIHCDVYGVCGPHGYCDRSESTCKCLRGFVPKSSDQWSKGNWTSGCRRRTELLCGKNNTNLSSNNAKKDGFVKLPLMKAPDFHEYLPTDDASGCEQQCSSNCSCVAYTFADRIGCLVWSGDLIDMQKFSDGGVDIFLRVAGSELGKESRKIKRVVILTAVFGVIFVGIIIYGLYWRISRQKATQRNRVNGGSPAATPPSGRLLGEEWGHRLNQQESLDLPIYDFNTLAAATSNFSESNKLGAGGFGPVYKGMLEDGQEVAVKRLSIHSGQGIIEFKNEISLISKLKHRNLVKLLGYCIKGDEKLLIYEYLKNKSLDKVLFDKKSGVRFDWAKRCDIIEGIARGLLYLHRDSCLRVIHRDLKASNILLDDKMNPKISDFGLARAFQITQELANTHRVVGTFGYMSPEYAMGGLFSEKSDVFSFGVLLLEIISGMRNAGFHYQEKYVNLLGYAWHLWEEGKGLDLLDEQLTNSCPQEEFLKYMQIGLLCVQDHPFDRPTMSVVVLMLTTNIDIAQPKQPTFYQGLLNSDTQSQSSNVLSKNDMSITMVEGR